MPKKRAAKKAAKKAAKTATTKRAEKRNKDIVESQTAAASRIGCPIEHVKLAKSLGSLAFMPNNRISIEQLTDYLATPEFRAAVEANVEQDSAKVWDARLKRAKALQAEHKLEVERGKVWDAEQTMQLLGAGNAAIRETLKRFLESEQPPLVEGKSAGQILKLNQRFYDQLVREIRSNSVRAIEKLGETFSDDEE